MVATGRVKAWKKIFEGNHEVPLPYDRQNEVSTNSLPYCVSIRTAEVSNVKTSKSSTFQISLTFYDLTYKQFYGRTWRGPLVPGKSAGGKTKITYNQNVYFHTSLDAEALVVVLEVVAVEPPGVDGKQKEVGCGWSLFHPFQKEKKLSDTSGTAPPVVKLDMFHGSPRALMFLDEPIIGNPNLNSNGCQVQYVIQTHRIMQKSINLIPENTFVSHHDVIPGISDAEKSSSGGDFLRRPRLLKQMPGYLDKIQVTLNPSLEKLEEELCNQLNEDRINRENKVADGTNISVVERRLQIGVHNGWCYVDKPQVVHLTPDVSSQKGGSRGRSGSRGHQRTPSTSSVGSGTLQGATTLVHKNRIELDDLVEDPMFTLVFLLEYVLGEPIGKSNKDRRASMAKSATFNITVRWAAWCPLSNIESPEQSIQLIGGPSAVPDSIFVYSLSAENVGSLDSVKNLNGGVLKFTFVNTKGGLAKQRERDPTQTMLSVPTLNVPTLNLPDTARTQDDTDLLEGQVVGRPPIPASARTMDQFGQSFASQQSMYHPGQMYGMPMGMPGYPSSGYASVPGFGGASPPYGATSPIPGYGGVSPVYGAAAPGMMGVMGYGGQASLHSYQPSPRMNVPVEIAHVRDSVTPGQSGMVPELTELPFTPVHAPVMATVPGRHIVSGMSRQAYARLFTVGFPQILDQHGEPPEVMDPNDDLQFIMTKEETDRLQTNEITLQFLAFARVVTPDSVREKPTPSSVFMTFQFYRFPQVTTERLLLGTLDGQLTSDPNAIPSILQKLNADGSLKKGPPGWQVVYNVDPAYLKPGEGRLFVQHLSQQILHIDIWDGDSLLLIGSCAVELKHLCRQGREAVQTSYELDVITTEYIDYDTPTPAGNMAQQGFLKPMEVKSLVKGKLHLRMANVGRPADAKLSKTDRMPMSVKPKIIVSSDSNGLSQFNGGSLGSLMQHTAATLKPKKCKAKHMVDKNQELAAMIYSRKNEDRTEKSGETNAARKRKLSRMEAVRSQMQEEVVSTTASYRTEKEERARDLQTIDLFRKQNKREEILGMLSKALTTEHVLYPSMGSTEFFEFVLKNPYNVEHTVTIQCDDPELIVITDPREWRHFKMVHEIYTSVEEGMFSAEAGKNVDPPQLFLRAKESVNIPFKFLTLKADNVAHQAIPADPHRPKAADAQSYPGIQKRDPMATRVARVFFNTLEGKPVGILQAKIEPQPHVIDQTFRFHHPEHSFLKKSIRLPPLYTIPGVPIGGPGISQLVVRCSDPNIICESRKVQPGEPHDIFIKVACGASPQVKKFFLAIYADNFMSRPITIWQIFVHALQRVDIAGSEGQTSRFNLILRGTQASRLVKCFTSHPLEMSIRPNEPFMLAAGSLQELEVGLRPLVSGSKFYYINVVDVEYHLLVRSWLVCLTMSQPLITKNYELTLPVGGGKGSNKRLAYTNPYPTRKVFTIHCNRPDLLQFKDTRMDLGPGEVHHIGLRFAPAIAPGATEILVFINDLDDKNEETFCVRASYQ